MRISDWSSDVCSSDLAGDVERLQLQLDIVGEIILRRQVDIGRAADLAIGAAVRLVIARAVAKIGAQREAPFFEPQRSARRSEEHTSELQSLMRISYAVFCLKTKMKMHTHKPTLP